MIQVKTLTKYDENIAKAMRQLLIELSRLGRDRGDIPEEWFNDIISSPWHDVLLAVETDEHGVETVLGMVTVSVVFGAGIRKNTYLEDFVVSSEARGKGVGGLIWNSIIAWARDKGCNRVEFDCGHGRENAQAFYKKHGAEIYDTNFFRVELNKK